MDTSLIGVDIGATAVRAVRLAGVDRDGFALVERFGVAPLVPGAVRAGKILDVEACAAALRAAVALAGGRRHRRVVLGAMAPEAAVAEVQLAATVPSGDRLRALRTLEVQVTPTIPTAEAALAAVALRRQVAADDREVVAMSVAAVPASELEVLGEVADAAGCVLEAVDLAAAATLRALVRDTAASREVATVVDVGASRTTVVTREGCVLRSVRAFPAGGDDLTRAVASATKEEWSAAERRKMSMRLSAAPVVVPPAVYGDLAADVPDDDDDPWSRTSAEAALAAAAELLVDQVAQAVETDAARLGRRTAHLALCGGTSLSRGLSGRLQRRLGVETRVGHPWAFVLPSRRTAGAFLDGPNGGPELVPGREDPRLMLSLATACGLALRPRLGVS